MQSEDEFEEVIRPVHLSRKLGHIQTTPLLERRTKEETAAIFDDLLSQMEGAKQTLGQHQTQLQSHSSDSIELENQSKTRSQSRSNDSLESDSVQEQNGVDGLAEKRERARVAVIAKRRVKSSDVPRSRDMVRRPSSSASCDNKGEEEGEGPVGGDSTHQHPPRAASVESDLVFATLPHKKKKNRKWSGIRRIGSPLFKSRRKSFTNTTSSADRPSSLRVSVTGPTPSVSLTTATPTSKVKEVTPQPACGEAGHGSHDQLKTAIQSTRAVVSPPAEGEGAGANVQGILGARGKRRRSSGVPKDECLNALKVMTTLSCNKECLNSLVSYICLPKCVSK